MRIRNLNADDLFGYEREARGVTLPEMSWGKYAEYVRQIDRLLRSFSRLSYRDIASIASHVHSAVPLSDRYRFATVFITRVSGNVVYFEITIDGIEAAAEEATPIFEAIIQLARLGEKLRVVRGILCGALLLEETPHAGSAAMKVTRTIRNEKWPNAGQLSPDEQTLLEQFSSAD